MSHLTTLAAHARTMSTAQHKPECPVDLATTSPYRRPCGRQAGHGEHEHFWSGFLWVCGGRCPGCVSDDERALWKQQADELEAHLGGGV